MGLPCKTASCFQLGVRFPDGTLQTTAAVGSGGTVTSFSAGTLSPLFITSVATPTTTPSLTFSLSTQGNHVVLAGPTSGGPLSPTFRLLVTSDIPNLPASIITSGQLALARGGTAADLSGTGGTSFVLRQSTAGAAITVSQLAYSDISGTVPTPPSGSVLWSALGNASGNLTLANGTNTTEFDQTANTIWLWKNTTVATVSTTNASPLLELAANYWTGAASTADTWTIGSSLAAGTNGVSTLSIAHSGSTGQSLVLVPAGAANVPSLCIGVSTVGFWQSSNALNLQTVASGTSSLNLYVGSTNCAVLNFSSTLCTLQHNVNTGTMKIQGQATTGTVAAVTLTNGNNFTGTSGTQVGVQAQAAFAPTSGTAIFVPFTVLASVNQTGGANGNYTALKINVVETALGGSANLLLDLQAGAAGGTSKFSVTNGGHLNSVADFAGQATITAGGTTKAVSFTVNYTGTGQPIIILTPTSDPLVAGTPVGYWVTYSGGAGAWTGFTVNIQTALAGDVTFNYIVVGNR